MGSNYAPRNYHFSPVTRRILSPSLTAEYKSMIIANGSVVSFHYVLQAGENDSELSETESSLSGTPSVYLHGAANILPGLEIALSGKSAGEKLTVILPPHRGYGLYNASNVQRVPIKHLVLPTKGKARAGMLAQLNTSEGARSVTIIKAGRHSAEVDTNHPLAGKTVKFDIEIIEVRPATDDEKAHGHAHGPGGHQH